MPVLLEDGSGILLLESEGPVLLEGEVGLEPITGTASFSSAPALASTGLVVEAGEGVGAFLAARPLLAGLATTTDPPVIGVGAFLTHSRLDGRLRHKGHVLQVCIVGLRCSWPIVRFAPPCYDGPPAEVVP